MGAEIMEFYILYSRYFAYSFFSAYTILVLLLLCCSGLLVKKIKDESFNWLFVVHSLLPWLYIVSLVFQIAELYMAWYGQNPYELHAFYEGNGFVPFRLFYIMMFVVPLFSLLFLARRLRTNRIFIAAFLLLFNSGTILIFFSGFNKDYLPSSWQIQHESMSEQVLKWVLLPPVLLLLYLFIHRRNKLPNPSLFLKSNVQPF